MSNKKQVPHIPKTENKAINLSACLDAIKVN